MLIREEFAPETAAVVLKIDTGARGGLAVVFAVVVVDTAVPEEFAVGFVQTETVTVTVVPRVRVVGLWSCCCVAEVRLVESKIIVTCPCTREEEDSRRKRHDEGLSGTHGDKDGAGEMLAVELEDLLKHSLTILRRGVAGLLIEPEGTTCVCSPASSPTVEAVRHLWIITDVGFGSIRIKYTVNGSCQRRA
jgi:hypothetical protein